MIKITRRLVLSSVVIAGSFLSVQSVQAQNNEVNLTVALAANPLLETAAGLIDHFYANYPGIKVRFQILPENQLRPAVLRDVATGSGQFDIVMLGSYEVPLWAQKGWIVNLGQNYVAQYPDWQVDDLTTPIRNLVSWQGDMYATPFYGSSSFLFYRKDLFAQAGLTMPSAPTWDEIADFAAKLTDRDANQSGICLRGLPGWGQNTAPLTSVLNAFGGRWFDENWQPQLSSPKSRAAINFYVDLIRNYGQPDAAKDGWQECLQLFTQGRVAIWYDDTVFAGPVLDQASEAVKGNVGFALAPRQESHTAWLWAWGLAIPQTSTHKEEAWKLISWLTSQEYIKLAGEQAGWDSVPPGSRTSTYQLPQYAQAAVDYADLTLQSINMADPLNPTIDPVPYTGVQYVSIPEFEQIGDFFSQQLAGALSGQISADAAIEATEAKIRDVMSDAGYTQ